METIPSEMLRAAADARTRLSSYARATAIGTVGGGNDPAAAMAGAAREALFTDALLASMRARLAELKGVAK